MKSALTKQRGVALITTMLITAIVAVVASELTSERHRITDRTIKLIASDQGLISIWSIENFVKIVLAQDAKESTADFPGEDWTINATIPIDNGLISGRLTDESGKFNINNIIARDDQGKFKQGYPFDQKGANQVLTLLRNLDVDYPEELISAIIDFMDGDSDVYRGIKPFRGAEDTYYLSQDPAYRTANRPLYDLSELKLVKGMSAEIYDAIEPHLTALPKTTAVNANFATAQTLRMLSDKITVELAEEIVLRQNKKDAFKSYNELIGFMESYTATTGLAQQISIATLDVKTQFVRLKMSTNLAGAITNSTSIIERDKQTSIIAKRTFGGS